MFTPQPPFKNPVNGSNTTENGNINTTTTSSPTQTSGNNIIRLRRVNQPTQTNKHLDINNPIQLELSSLLSPKLPQIPTQSPPTTNTNTNTNSNSNSLKQILNQQQQSPQHSPSPATNSNKTGHRVVPYIQQVGYPLGEDARKSRTKFSDQDVKALCDLVILFGKDVKTIKKYKPFNTGRFSERQLYDKVRSIKKSGTVPIYPDEPSKKRARLSLGLGETPCEDENNNPQNHTNNSQNEDEDDEDTNFTDNESDEDDHIPQKTVIVIDKTTNNNKKRKSTFQKDQQLTSPPQQQQLPPPPQQQQQQQQQNINNSNNNRLYPTRSKKILPTNIDEPITNHQNDNSNNTNNNINYDQNDISPPLSATSSNSSNQNYLNNKSRFPPHTPTPPYNTNPNTNNILYNAYHSLITPNTQSFYKFETSRNLLIYNPFIAKDKITTNFENDILTILVSNPNIFDFIKEKGNSGFKEDTCFRIDFPHPGKSFGPPRRVNELPEGVPGVCFIFEKIKEGNVEYLDYSTL